MSEGFHSVISNAFHRLRAHGRKALIPYFAAGFPDVEGFERLVGLAAEEGSDLVEVGIPFSDPLADGPSIQHATKAALTRGITLSIILGSVERLARRTGVPIVLMGYANPILAAGLENFARRAAGAGAAGAIVPDLPVEEAAEAERVFSRAGLDLILLAAPTSPPERIRKIVRHSSGFVYLVSTTGVTGARDRVPSDLRGFIARVRRETDKPLCVGFGISTPAQARAVAELADGVIVGSALVNAVRKGGEASAVRLVKSIRRSMDRA